MGFVEEPLLTLPFPLSPIGRETFPFSLPPSSSFRRRKTGEGLFLFSRITKIPFLSLPRLERQES